MLMMTVAETNANDDLANGEEASLSSSQNSSNEIKPDTTTNNDEKPKSRLAMLAEDWMAEEEGEDELADYWGRFEDNKSIGKKTTTVDQNKDGNDDQSASSSADDDQRQLTTEERLERYFDSRGINKQKEKKHAVQIQQAIAKATSILDTGRPPQQAIQALQSVQPYLQVNTRLGGMALIQLASALWQNDQRDEALLLCEQLKSNRHVRKQVIKFIEDGPEALNKQKQNKSTSFWKGTIFDRDLSSSWWD